MIHFTRNTAKDDGAAFQIKGKEHVANTARKGTEAALQLRRLGMLSPQAARQLFTAPVALMMDYACNVWIHACGSKEMALLRKAQRIGAQAITGAFRTVATAVAKAEAGLL